MTALILLILTILALACKVICHLKYVLNVYDCDIGDIFLTSSKQFKKIKGLVGWGDDQEHENSWEAHDDFWSLRIPQHAELDQRFNNLRKLGNGGMIAFFLFAVLFMSLQLF